MQALSNKTPAEIETFIRTTWARLWTSEGQAPAIREINIWKALCVRFEMCDLGFWLYDPLPGHDTLGFDLELLPERGMETQDIRTAGLMMIRVADLVDAIRGVLTKA